MAVMIPNINPSTIENDGEKAFYSAALKLPSTYTSYKYRYKEIGSFIEILGEADFIIVHPSLGYVVIEVKQGDIKYINGEWSEYKENGYRPLKKDPVEQAKKAMFAILEFYRDKAKNNFSLKIKYAVCFPESSKVYGNLPADLSISSIFFVWTVCSSHIPSKS